MTYVYRDGPATRTWGKGLTEEQRKALVYEGIHPEGIDIVYIDEDYNVLSEKPKPYNEEEWAKENAIYVLDTDGLPMTPEEYEELMGEPMPERMRNWYEENHADEMPAVPSVSPEVDAMRAAAREAAEAERVKFEQGLRELEKLMNMSDAEIAAELERRFTPQLPELPTDENLENQVRSEIQSTLMTPARFEKALRILKQYGPEEGMQRLRTADPKLAEQVHRILGRPPAQHPPEKPENAAAPTRPPEGPPEHK